MRITTSELRKVYFEADHELPVVNSLSFTFPDKGAVAIVGRSGVGKSTLLHLLGGLDRPSSGSVCYDETNLARLSSDDLALFRGRHVGFVFQFHQLLPEFDALENVAMPLLINGATEAAARKTAAELLNRVGLAERLDHRPGELSGGEQQRVAIARAVVTRPAVMLCDEPTGNLDVATSDQISRLLLDLNRELNNLIIVVTHNLELAGSMDLTLEMQPGGNLTPV